jgi:hypothetical protein
MNLAFPGRLAFEQVLNTDIFVDRPVDPFIPTDQPQRFRSTGLP